MGQHLSRSGKALASTQDHKRKTMFSGYTVLENKIYLMINSLNSCDSRQISNLKIQKSDKPCLEKPKKYKNHFTGSLCKCHYHDFIYFLFF